ncbi:MAG: YfhO family protein [Methylobacteriaceae bacterium]|nr:YfhO family protein [Methylobacteriaceae bacterium]
MAARPVLPATVAPSPDWTRRELALALLAIAAIWAAAAALWPLSGTVVPWDSKNHFFPMLRFLGASLADGELPLWNPYHFSGHPAVADPQSLLFTPTMLLFGWLVPAPSMQLFDLVVFAHLLPGALAFPALFRARGWRPEGAVVAAAIFMLGGSASARLQHTGIIFGYGLFPLALLLLEGALAKVSYWRAVAFAAVASVMVVGRDQVAFLSGLALVAFVAAEAARSDAAGRYILRRAGILLTAGIVGAAILAVPVILTLQFLATSTRPSFGYGVAAMGSLPPESFATVLFANVFGSLRWTYDYWGPDWHSLIEGTWTDRATNYLFVGTVPALLILWHGIAGGRLLAREFRFFLGLLVVASLYAVGRYTPIFSVVFDSLPGVALYRRPADASFLINIGLAFAGGYLVHRYALEGNPRWSMLRRSPGGAILVALAISLLAGGILTGLTFALRAHKTAPAAGEIALALLGAAALAWGLGRLARDTRSRLVAASLLTLATGGELAWRNAASALNAEPAERYAVFQGLPAAQLAGLRVLQAELAARQARGEHPRVEVLGLGGGWQNASMMLGLEDTIGYNPLRLADYEKAVGPGENAVDPNLRQFPGTFRGYRCRLARLLGLEYLVLDRPVERLPRHFPRLRDAKLLYGAEGMWVYRVEDAAPRAYFASEVVPVDAEAVLSHGEIPEFDRRHAVLVDTEANQDGAQTPRDDAGEDGATTPVRATVAIRDYRRNAVSLDVDTDRSGVVVLHDIYYPGWEARVDGKPVTILKANLLFRGVEVGAGHHRIEFRFRPLSAENLAATAADFVREIAPSRSAAPEPVALRTAAAP